MQEVQVGNSRYIRDLNLTGIFRLIQKYDPFPARNWRKIRVIVLLL